MAAGSCVNLRVNLQCVYSEAPVQEQPNLLEEGFDILVGRSGRMDHFLGVMETGNFSHLVVDEAVRRDRKSLCATRR